MKKDEDKTREELIDELRVLRFELAARRMERCGLVTEPMPGDDSGETLERFWQTRGYLESILESSPDAIGIVNRRGYFIGWNQMATELFGYRSEQLRHKHYSDLYEDPNELKRMLAELRERGVVRQFEVNLHGSEGRITPCSVFIRLLRNTEGRTIGSVCVVRDLTEIRRTWTALEEANRMLQQEVEERRKYQEELDQAKGYLENVLENSPDAIGIADRRGQFLLWNRMAEQLYGYSAEEVKQMRVFDLYADSSSLDWMLAELREHGTVKAHEIDMKTKEGRRVPFEVSISLLKDAEEQVIGSVCVARDLTEIKRTLTAIERTNAQLQKEIEGHRHTEAALRESRHRYRIIFENTGTATIIIEEDGSIVLANTEFVILSGYSREELEGRMTWMDFFAREDCQWMMEYHRLRRIDATAAPRNYEASFVDRSREIKTVFMTVAMIPGTARSVASFLDITERKEAERALQRSNEELEQRTFEILELNRMLDLLQVCRVESEVYEVVAHYAGKLFPLGSGCLSMYNERHSELERLIGWGNIETGEPSFVSEDCWALRQGKPHSVEAGGRGVCCRHLKTTPENGFLCVPMIAHGEVLGLFHLQYGALPDGLEPSARQRLYDAKRRLAGALTDHVALALANLRLRETLRQQSIRDPLTGLFNRRYMEETLHREIRRAERHGHALAVVMMDVDHFKCVNDTCGHEMGDIVLAELGRILGGNVRAEDIACRYGGEEFVLVMPGMSSEDVAERTQQLRNEAAGIEISGGTEGAPRGITLSAGIAMYPWHGENRESLLNRADQALYAAKQAGRDRVMLAEDAAVTAPLATAVSDT